MNKRLKIIFTFLIVLSIYLADVGVVEAYYFNNRYYPDIGYESASYTVRYDSAFNQYGLPDYYRNYDPYDNRGSYQGYNNYNFNYNSYVQSSVDVRVDDDGRYRGYPYSYYGYYYPYSSYYPYSKYNTYSRNAYTRYNEPYYSKYDTYRYYDRYNYPDTYYDARYYYYN